MDLEALEMPLDEGGRFIRPDRPFAGMAADGLDHHLLDLGCWRAPDDAGLLGPPLRQGAAHVVAVAHAALAGMGRRHAVAAAVEDAAGEDRLAPGAQPLRVGVGGKPLLHGLEGFPVDDRIMLAGIDLASVLDLARVEAVVQEIGDGTGPKGMPPTVRPLVSPRTAVVTPRRRSSASRAGIDPHSR